MRVLTIDCVKKSPLSLSLIMCTFDLKMLYIYIYIYIYKNILPVAIPLKIKKKKVQKNTLTVIFQIIIQSLIDNIEYLMVLDNDCRE
jgi:hypothetical protein